MANDSITIELDSATNALDPATRLQRVHLFTLGTLEARDGRAWRLDDPHAVIAATVRYAGKTELPIDFDHQTDFSQENGRPAPAAGWIKRFEADEEGIWAVVEWTDIAAQMIQRKQYRYISPTFDADKSGKILRILRAALTNAPALNLTQIASMMGGQGMADDLSFQDKVAILLGLETTANEDEVISALQALMNAETAVDGDDVKAVASLVQTLNTERSNFHMARVRDKVGKAIASGVMPPSMRGWMTRLCASNEEAFDELLTKVGTPFESLFKEQITDKHMAALGESSLSKDADAEVAKQLGIDPEKMR